VGVPFIQHRRSVLIVAMPILSMGGRSGTSTVKPEGSNMYPPSRDQIAATSTGSMTNNPMQTAGQPKKTI
jgi:hypothetical protein